MLELSLVAALVLGILVFVACNRADRAKDFAAAGPGLGMQFSDDLPEGTAAAIRAMPSVARRTRNFFPRVLANPEAMVFDWVWQDDRFKDRNRATQTVVALRRPGAAMPAFLLAEKAAIAREDARAAGDEVAFTSPSRWLDRYVLLGDEKEALRRLFPEAAREALTLPAGLRVEGAGEWVIVYGPERDVDPATFTTELASARALVESWVSPPTGSQ